MTVKRTFRYRDADLLGFAGVMTEHLKNHEATLQRFDPGITQEWYRALFEAARENTLDDFERGKVSSAARRVVEQRAACHTLYKQVRYFVRLAFGKSPARLRPFDLESYAAVYSSKYKLLHFFKAFAKQMRMEAAALMAIGARPELLDEMERGVKRLDELLTESTDRQHRRYANTSERVLALNALFAALQRIRDVAAFAIPADALYASDFKLPKPKPSRKRSGPPAGASN